MILFQFKMRYQIKLHLYQPHQIQPNVHSSMLLTGGRPSKRNVQLRHLQQEDQHQINLRYPEKNIYIFRLKHWLNFKTKIYTPNDMNIKLDCLTGCTE